MTDKKEGEEVDPLAKTLDKVGAYSEIGFVSNPCKPFSVIDHLDTSLKWNCIPRVVQGKYRPNGELNFGDALQAMRAGYSVMRKAWEGNETKGPITLGNEDTVIGQIETKRLKRPFFIQQHNERYSSTVLEMSVEDLTATDWWIVVGNREIGNAVLKHQTNETPS